MGAAHRLPVNGHHVLGQSRSYRRDPLDEACLELLGIELGEHVREGIVRGDAVGQVQEGAKPALLRSPESFHAGPVIGPADQRAQGDHEDIAELVTAVGRRAPRVVEVGKMVGDRIE